jgi:tetratricopeptide (TPR) repeat protein
VFRVAPIVVLLLAGSALAQELTPEQSRESEALVAKGITVFDRQDFPAAIEVFLAARELNPFDVRPPFYLAQCEFNLWKADPNEARAKRFREYIEEARRINDQFGGAHFLLGVFSVQIRDYGTAVDAFSAAMERGFEVRSARANLAESLFFLGVSRASQDVAPTELTIRIFEDARTRLEVLKDDLRYPQAEREQMRGLWVAAMVNLVAVYQKAGDLPRALELIASLMKIEPENPLHHHNLGLLHGSNQKFEEALGAYQRALDLNKDPGWVEPHLRMACIYSQDGRYDLAEHHFDEFFAKLPDHMEGRYRYAEHWSRKKDPERAVAAWQRCVELVPLDLQGMVGLGRALTLLGRKTAAEKWLGLSATLEALGKERDAAEEERTGRTPGNGAPDPSESGPKEPSVPPEEPK